MTPLIHNYTNKANKTFDWDTSDNQDWYLKNLADPEIRQRIADLGFIDNPIQYKFNSHGFRTAEFDQQFDIVCFGCSYTMGTGVHAHNTWPSQLASLTGLRVANLGHAGSSNDTAFRFANHYLKFLKPKYAVWLQTDMHRLELLDNATPMSLKILAGDNRNPCASDYFTKIWFTTDENQLLNLEKNTLAFQQVCENLGIESIILSRTQVPPHGLFPYSRARDLTHPGVDDYKELVQRIQPLLNRPETSLRITEAPNQ
jgi:hypothetical protein